MCENIPKEMEPLTEIERDMVEKNRYLVWYMIGKMKRKIIDQAIENDDLFQSGVIGLMRAVKTFDEEKASFSTYAGIWINRYIEMCLSDYSLIRIPEKRNRDRFKIKKILEENPDVTFLDKEISNIREFHSIEKFEKFLSMKDTVGVLYIDSGTKIQCGGTAYRNLIREKSQCPEETVRVSEQIELLSKSVDSILDEDGAQGYTRKAPVDIKKIVAKRHFVNGESLASIGRDYGLTRERIRQISNKARADIEAFFRERGELSE